MKVRSIIFDLDDVLYDSTTFSQHARLAGLRAIQRYYKHLPIEKLERDMAAILAKKGSNHPKLFNDILKANAISESDPNFYFAVADAIKCYHDRKYDQNEFQPFSDTKETLLELYRRGIKLGIITNGLPEKQCDKIIRLGLKEFFRPEYVIISQSIGYEKPCPKIYKIALERMDVEAKETAYCDDRAEHVEGAILVGMIGVRMLKGKYSKEYDRVRADFVIQQLSELLDIFE